MRAMSMPHGERSVGGWHREGVSDEAASRLADQSIPEDAPAGAVSSRLANCTALCSVYLVVTEPVHLFNSLTCKLCLHMRNSR